MMRTSTAVDDIAAASASTSATGADIPGSNAHNPQIANTLTTVDAIPAARMCTSPRRKARTSRCSPMPNISRITARFEMDSTASPSPTNPSACGPTIAPAIR
jgi:hypothetical protein